MAWKQLTHKARPGLIRQWDAKSIGLFRSMLDTMGERLLFQSTAVSTAAYGRAGNIGDRGV